MPVYIGPTPPNLSSILAAESCETCRQSTLETPTIVHSVKDKTPSHICESRNIPDEWALGAVLHLAARRDRYNVRFTPINGQSVSPLTAHDRSTKDDGILSQAQDLLARFSLAKTGWSFGPSEDTEIAQIVPREATFAEACLSAVSQVQDLAL